MKNIKLKIGMILISSMSLFLLSGCSGGCRTNSDSHNREAVNAQLDTPITLRFGQIAIIESEKLFVEFIEITEDSRCPVGVVCAWEGQATALIGFNKDDNTHAQYSVTSRAGHPDLAVTKFDNYVINLNEISPEKIAGEKIELSEYKITLTISKTDQ